MNRRRLVLLICIVLLCFATACVPLEELAELTSEASSSSQKSSSFVNTTNSGLPSSIASSKAAAISSISSKADETQQIITIPPVVPGTSSASSATSSVSSSVSQPMSQILGYASKSYYRNFLSDLEKQVYDSFANRAISYSKESFSVEGLSVERLFATYEAFCNDFPEYFYIEGVSYTAPNFSPTTARLSFNGTQAEIQAKQAQINFEAQQILALVPSSGSDYDQVLFLHDYLAGSIEYSMESPDNQNIYSALVEKKTVCAGYARSMQYLLGKLGIYCIYVTGTGSLPGRTGEPHAWNIIKLGGYHYLLDLTWSDMETTNPPFISYDYFAVTTAYFSSTHTPSNPAVLPECTHTESNYFVKEGLLFSSYSSAVGDKLVSELLEGNANKKTTYAIRFSSKSAYDSGLNSLIQGGMTAAILKVNQTAANKLRITYNYVPSAYNFTIHFIVSYI